MKERYSEKIRNKKGMTLSEVLIAVLLLSLATGIIVTCISLGTRLFRREMRISQAQMLLDALTVSIEDELRYATGIETAYGDVGKANFSYSSRNRAGKKRCYLTSAGEGYQGKIVMVCPGETKPYTLVSQRLYKGLEAELSEALWVPDAMEFQMKITIKDAADHQVITTKTFHVTALNGDYNL